MNKPTLLSALMALAFPGPRRMPLTALPVAPTSTGVLLTHEAKPGWRKAAKRRVYRKLMARRRANGRAR